MRIGVRDFLGLPTAGFYNPGNHILHHMPGGPVLQGVAEKAAFLRGFHLSLLGRVLAAKVYLLSKVWYTAAARHLPSSVLKQLNRIVFNYIHGSAPRDRSVPGRLSRGLLSRPPAHGGAGVPLIAEAAVSLSLCLCDELLPPFVAFS